jgi:hypothetical protein
MPIFPSHPMLAICAKRGRRLEAVAVLNSIPDWFAIFAGMMIAAASTKIKSAFQNLTKRNKRGQVIKMTMKLTTGLWWASACVGSAILVPPAESG